MTLIGECRLLQKFGIQAEAGYIKDDNPLVAERPGYDTYFVVGSLQAGVQAGDVSLSRRVYPKTPGMVKVYQWKPFRLEILSLPLDKSGNLVNFPVESDGKLTVSNRFGVLMLFRFLSVSTDYMGKVAILQVPLLPERPLVSHPLVTP